MYIKQVSIAILTVIVMKIGNQVSYEPNGAVDPPPTLSHGSGSTLRFLDTKEAGNSPSPKCVLPLHQFSSLGAWGV